MHSGLTLILFVIVAIEWGNSAPNCKLPILANGNASWSREYGNTVNFTCNPSYELSGYDTSPCIEDFFLFPAPICVKSGCTVPNIENGVAIATSNGTYVSVSCKDGFALAGNRRAYCNGTHWDRDLGTCWGKNSLPLSCDFETEEICGWTNEHDGITGDWARTPNMCGNPPSNRDHFMLAQFLGEANNWNARLLSPNYPAELSKGACFSFWYLLTASGDSLLNVYVKTESIDFRDMRMLDLWKYPESLKFTHTEKNVWKRGSFNLTAINEDFQIMIAAITSKRGKIWVAIDDVKLMSGSECSPNATLH